MKQKVYVVWDKTAEECGPPFVAKNDAVAHRQYARMLAEKNAPADELELVRVGEMESDQKTLSGQLLFGFEPEIVDAQLSLALDEEEDAI